MTVQSRLRARVHRETTGSCRATREKQLVNKRLPSDDIRRMIRCASAVAVGLMFVASSAALISLLRK